MTLAVIITVMGTAFANGNGAKKDRAAIIPGNDITFKVLYDIDEPTVVRIKIKDENGALVRTDKIKNTEGFMQRYNFSSLKEGKYVVELSDKYGVVSQEVEVKTPVQQATTVLAKN